MKLLTIFLLIQLAFFNCFSKAQANVVTYPGPSTMTPSTVFNVTVNGESLFVYKTQMGNGWQKPSVDAAFTYFDFDGGNVLVEIEDKTGRIINSVKVLPESKGIKPVISGSKISFSINAHQKLWIKINNDATNSLFLFSNPILKAPDKNDPNLIYYGPGEYYIGGNGAGTVTLKSNQTLFVDGGAVVHGFILTQEATNVKIMGHGIIDGNYIAPKGNNGQPFLNIRGGSNISVSGVILNNSPHWTVVPVRASQVTIDNIKIINSRGNSDGIDPCNSSNVNINNCFIASYDDAISTKGCVWNFTYPDSKDAAHSLINAQYKCQYINVVGSTLFSTGQCGGIRIGDETVAPEMSDMLFEDNDIIDAGNCFMVDAGDRALVSNILFENNRLPANFPGYFASISNLKTEFNYDLGAIGKYKNIYFRNIWSMRDPNTTATIGGYDAVHPVTDVTFEGVVCGPKKNKLWEATWACSNYANIKYIDGGATPGQVSNRFVQEIGKDTATIHWDILPPDYQSFELRYRKIGATDWITQTSTSTTGYKIIGLQAGSDYEWQIRTISTPGTSEWSYLQVFSTVDDASSSSLLKETGKNQIKCYPNPTNDFIKVTFNNTIDSDYSADVFDSLGKLMLSTKINKSEQETNLDLSRLSNGIYVLNIHNSSINSTFKIFKTTNL